MQLMQNFKKKMDDSTFNCLDLQMDNRLSGVDFNRFKTHP